MVDAGTRDRRRVLAGELHHRLAALQARAERHEPAALQPLAELRRAAGASFGMVPGADAALLRLARLPSEGDGPPPLTASLERLLDDALLVASLVALGRPRVRAREGRRGSFGHDLRTLRHARENAAEGLLLALLGSARADLVVHLRRAVVLLGSDGHGVDVAALVRDLGGWEWEGQPVQKRWAYDFWADAQEQDHDREGEP